jgi:transposase-like protein
MASKKTAKKSKAKIKRKPVSSETRAKHAELARKQWADPAGTLRKRRKEGAAKLRREPPKNVVALIEMASGLYGANITTLCAALQCHPNTLSAWRKRYPAIDEAVLAARQVEEDVLWGTLYRQATQEGNTIAAIVLLKFRGHRDSGPLPQVGPDSAVQQAAKIRAALLEMQRVDGELGGNEDAHAHFEDYQNAHRT